MTKAREYKDFHLELRDWQADTGAYEVAVPPSPEMGDPSPVAVTLDRDALADGLDDLDGKFINLEELIELGEALADRLLPAGTLRDLFIAQVRAAGRDGGVRLRLIIRDAALAQLPWEYAYLPIHQGEKGRNHFLVLNPQVSIVRHVPTEEQWPSIAPADPATLRLVAATANPEGYQQLQLRRERKVVEKALKDFDVDGAGMEWQPFMEDATLDQLLVRLGDKADLFHFSGHGHFKNEDIDPTTGAPIGEGGLVLVAGPDDRQPAWLPAADLALQLQAAGVRLAVLGACESGRQDGVTAWTGVAPALIGRGMPAVVAMQYEIQDHKAVPFVAMFYTALAAGLSVDEAMSAARLAVLAKSDEDGIEWGVPVLYMRSVDGVLFPRPVDQEVKTADGIRTVVEQTVGVIEDGGEVVGIEAKKVGGGVDISVKQKVDTVKDGKLVGARFDQLGG